jgi:hypothetical protein
MNISNIVVIVEIPLKTMQAVVQYVLHPPIFMGKIGRKKHHEILFIILLD